MTCVSRDRAKRHRISPLNRFWQIAALTVAGTIGVAARADAAVFWLDSDSGYSQPEFVAPPRVQPARRHKQKQLEAKVKPAAKPQAPLIIAISINKQNVKVYDANGLFASAPVSTGMTGHATPMGAFSVIQKQKMHHSNIYSNAPMPFMQRITWSGVAMHAGVLPGYRASHGCIRMPTAFAIKMYGWTKMGARVIVTPGESIPAPFSHPLLVTRKIAPQPAAANVLNPDTSTNGSKVANIDAEPATPEPPNLELRSTVGHDSHLIAVTDEQPAPASLNERTHTADASTSPGAKVTGTMSDTTTPASRTDRTAPAAERADNTDVTPETKSATAEPADQKKADPADPLAAPAKPNDVKASAKSDVTAATHIPADAADPKRDQDRDPAAAPEPALAMAKGTGPISVFISGKDGKLYVRQNFAPLFDVPVTIAPSDRPLGTHIFTAEADKTDPNILRWSVVTLPSSQRAERRDEDERSTRRRRIAGAAITKPEPDSPAEALDRLTIPADAMARITEALSTGGSIIVSDQGIAAGETGEGTDFIVSLR
ncbi:MAG: L,D-transpeptidase family protein [Bradyrhizobium sp.]|nr:L,D-transpeptidase family protein [Pseudomonadota bacterium]MDE2068526.1 L,D-transpeptidase family protein [Bradyrhizobium sp.]MDE2242557.1 L,D-transpeptidase family protein [Bradyrhizobium sp.]